MNISLSKLTVAVLVSLGWTVPFFPVRATTLPTPATDLYLVYQGTATHSEFDPSNSNTAVTTETDTMYLVTDLSFPSNYSILAVKTDGTYSISTRVLSSDATSMNGYEDGVLDSSADPTQNYIAGIHNHPVGTATSAIKGYAIFRYASTSGTSSLTINNVTHDYPKTTQIYGTGALSGLNGTVPVTLVAADTKTKVSGVYTVNAIPAALTNYVEIQGSALTESYPLSLAGPAFFYNIDPALVVNQNSTFPGVLSVSLTGSFTATLNTTLTSLANVGGSFKLKGQSSATTISPVAAQLNSGSSATVYEDFLFAIAKSLGLTPVYTPNP